MDLHVVLVNPEIPQNTGNIGRLTAANNVNLHLVKPLGFSLEDKYLKRAGLDYWPAMKLHLHESWSDFLATENPPAEKVWLYTTKSTISFSGAAIQPGDYLLFGCETKGLPEFVHDLFPLQRLRIPIDNPAVRSFNLANAVAVAIFDVRRSWGM